MVCVGCGESPGVPLHPFESGSPICGWCLRLSRQRDDVRSSRTASTYGRAGYEYPPSGGRMLKWGFESPTAPKKLKKVLTNRKVCDIIKTQRGKQGRSRRQDPRESGKSLTTKSSTARCSCVRDTNVNQTSQAEKMSRIRRIQKPLLLWCSSNGKTPAEQEENGGSTPPHHTIILQGNGWDFVLYQ